MPLIKVFTLESKTSQLVSADNFKSFVQKATEKLKFSPSKFVLKSEGAEIDDDDVFSEILKEYPKNLEIVALREGEEFDAEAFLNAAIAPAKDTSPSESKTNTMSSVLKALHDDSDGHALDTIMKEWMDKRKEIDGEMNPGSPRGASSVAKPSLLKSKTTVEAADALAKHKAEQEELERKIKAYEVSSKLKTETDKTRELQEKLEKLKERALDTKAKTMAKTHELELKVAKLELSNHKIAKIFEEFKQAEKVDICFMLDCTGSMSSFIEEAKTVIHRVTERLIKKFQNLSLRFAFVGYRDHGDGSDRIVTMNFAQDPDDFKRFVSSVNAKGGDDECEDIFGGLEEVTKLNWQNMSRVLLHIGDAPCHGSRFHVGAGDSHPGGDPRGLKIESLLKDLVDLKVSYYFTRINDSTLKMIEEFNGELSALGGQNIKVLDLKTADSLLDTVYKSISTTIHESKSRSRTMTLGKAIRAKTLAPLDWDVSKFKRYQVTLSKPIYDFAPENIKTVKIRYMTIDTELYMAPLPFAEGALRYAQAAYLVDPTVGRTKNKCVIKQSKFNDTKYNTQAYVEESIECQVMSVFLSEEFEKVSPSRKSIRFVGISYVKVHETGEFFSVEDYMVGDFFKMSNNAGYVDEDVYSATLDAFTHWTYQFTKEYLIVTDLQGIRQPSSYLLTDPAITCPDDPERFSGTNLALRGLKEVLKTHKCSHICQKLGLLKHAFQDSKVIRPVTSTMTQLK